MNHAVTLGVKNGKDGKPEKFVVLADPNVPMQQQRKAFHGLRAKHHGEYDEVQLWTSSSGRVKRKRTYSPSASSPAPEAVSTPVSTAPDTELEVDGAALLGESPETSPTSPPAEQPVVSPSADKKAAALAKARAAAAAKKAAKNKK